MDVREFLNPNLFGVYLSHRLNAGKVFVVNLNDK